MASPYRNMNVTSAKPAAAPVVPVELSFSLGLVALVAAIVRQLLAGRIVKLVDVAPGVQGLLDTQTLARQLDTAAVNGAITLDWRTRVELPNILATEKTLPPVRPVAVEVPLTLEQMRRVALGGESLEAVQAEARAAADAEDVVVTSEGEGSAAPEGEAEDVVVTSEGGESAPPVSEQAPASGLDLDLDN